jgi:hypothetical protein|tara:strand:+ start:457 stop:615 length:159 start_codon:yes stop_codon:yes gene_type:complete
MMPRFQYRKRSGKFSGRNEKVNRAGGAVKRACRNCISLLRLPGFGELPKGPD